MKRLIVMWVALSACGDRCDALCGDLGRQLAACQSNATTWEDLGARNRLEYVRECRQDWESLRSDLDGWQIQLGLNECGDGQDVLAELSCREILALYAPID
ncbi:MAG: hypothetical protein ACI855_001232 [Myxococcota bacterium]